VFALFFSLINNEQGEGLKSRAIQDYLEIPNDRTGGIAY
jgi:hypothetical protein